ncbi:MAG TPA: MbtH family NRPS accessory protein [Chloroflexia bacterium]|nr:MbtH family NRPS accessory protein [Chloroflexia bacterium]
MKEDEREDTTIYKVVVNFEEQYSIWPADRKDPMGWRDVGKHGTKAEYFAYLEKVWRDMGPHDLRIQTDEAGH